MGFVEVRAPRPPGSTMEKTHQIDHCPRTGKGLTQGSLIGGVDLLNLDTGQTKAGPCLRSRAGQSSNGAAGTARAADELGCEGLADKTCPTNDGDGLIAVGHPTIIGNLSGQARWTHLGQPVIEPDALGLSLHARPREGGVLAQDLLINHRIGKNLFDVRAGLGKGYGFGESRPRYAPTEVRAPEPAAARTGIVGGGGKNGRAIEVIGEVLQVAHTEGDVHLWLLEGSQLKTLQTDVPGHTLGCLRHELHEAHGTHRGPHCLQESRFLAHETQHPCRFKQLGSIGLVDFWAE